MAQSELEMTKSSSDDGEEVSTEGSESESESGKTTPPPPSSKVTQATSQSSSQESESDTGDEEEESSEGSESESESEMTRPPLPFSKVTPQSSLEESESDTDSPPKRSEKADPNIKPLASKPMDDEASRKPRPKNPTSRYSVKPLNGKRKAAQVIDEVVESKIQKKEAVTVAENAGEKKPLFQRLWSEEDEIVLLKGMIGYVEEKGKDPISDVKIFHKFVKSSLSVDVNNTQMLTKVKRLKAKFTTNVGKIEQNGKVRSLCNPHEKKMYDLSDKLWGEINKNPAMVTKKANLNVNGGLESGEDHSTGGIKFPITEEGIMNRALELASGDKKVELEAKWQDLKMQEFKLYLKKLEFIKEQGELVLNAIMKSGAS